MRFFKKNIESFPQSPSVYDSYGEAMAAQKNWLEAKKYYQLALDKNPGNMNAKEILDWATA